MGNINLVVIIEVVECGTESDGTILNYDLLPQNIQNLVDIALSSEGRFVEEDCNSSL